MTVPATGGGRPYDAKKALFDAFPDMRMFGKEQNDQMEAAGVHLSQMELRGADTSLARAALLELRWRTNATSDVGEARAALARLTAALDDPDPLGALDQDAEGSFAPGAREWFLKLDRSTDQLLAREWPWRIAPYFLERIDDPVRMVTYLQDLTWCDVQRIGCDTRKELNLAVSVIARLAMRGGQAGYLAGPGFVPALEHFVREWQDTESGFFGVTYVLDPDGGQARTLDLSLTFHMARYLPHLVRNWEGLVDTLYGLAGGAYPQGWLDDGKDMSDHNNYDVAEILHRAWRFMRPDQRRTGSALLQTMLKWCLNESVDRSGSVIHPDTGDMIPDAYYFAAAFLDTVGYFDRRKRFWTNEDFQDAGRLREAMVSHMGMFNPRLSVVADVLDRLGRRRPTSNAVL